MHEVELPELPETEREIRKDKLNTLVAATVTLLVTFMAICKIDDNNIVLRMQKVQAENVDNWSWYQALHIREDINNSKLTDLKSDMVEEDVPSKRKFIQAKITDHESLAQKIADKKEKVKEEAKTRQEVYETLNTAHEKFDFSEAAISIAVSLLALTSLLQKRFMYGVALVPSLFGVVKGIMGLMG